MELTVVGCSGSHLRTRLARVQLSACGRRTQGRTFSLLLDSVPARWARSTATSTPRELDAIGLSHLHPDHCLDLCALLRRGALLRRPRPGRRSILRPGRHAPSGWPGPTTRPRTATPSPARPIAEHVRLPRLAPSQRDRPVRGAYGAGSTTRWRRTRSGVDEPAGRRHAGLLRRHRALRGAGRAGPGADLLLCEAASSTARRTRPALHLSGRRGRRARRPRPGSARLVLTHIPPWHDRDRGARRGTPALRRPGRAGQLGAVRHRPVTADGSRAEPRTGCWRPPPIRVATGDARADGRALDQLREVRFTRGWLDQAEGSVLVEFGETRVLVAASVTEGVPRWRKGSGLGWVTSEYAMLPAGDQHPLRPRVGQGPGRRPDPRDQPADRPQPARRSSTTRRWARTRSCSTATSCRPTAAPGRPPSPVPTWPWPTP